MFALELAWDRPAKLPNERTDHVLRARIIPQQQSISGLPLHLAIALDTSGSMEGEKLSAAKQSLNLVLTQLRQGDRLSLCSFNSQVNPILDNVAGGDLTATRNIDSLHAGGTTRTDLALEWIQHTLPNRNGVALVGILITDGHATTPQGKVVEDISPLLDRATGLARSNISLYAVGLGNAANFNTSFLTSLSDRGRGGFLYADTPASLEPQLRERLQSCQVIASEGASLQVRCQVDGMETTGFCRFRPEFLPLETSPTGSIALGALAGDRPTDILISFVVPASIQNFGSSGSSITKEVVTVSLQAKGMNAPATASASLLYTSAYREATQRIKEVDDDRLGWEINIYQDEIQRLGDRDPNRTSTLLSNIQVSAIKSGRQNVAESVAQQQQELQKTGKLDPHKTAQMTHNFRNTTEGLT
jgi:Ca-activated chloride channel family protein